MRQKKVKPFVLETDLCAAFLARIEKDHRNWVAYAETHGWDILLANTKTGIQIGIQAKLKLNAEVVSQSLRNLGAWRVNGPDHRAVLVPAGEAGNMATICDHLGIKVIHQHSPDQQKHIGYSHLSLPDGRNGWCSDGWHQWCPEERHKLPDYIPDVKAGDSAPLTLSSWKISAIKLALILEQRPVTRKDIKALNMSPTRWVDKFSGYLVATPDGYVASDKYMPDLKRMHPKNWEQIKGDMHLWGQPFGVAEAKQIA